MADTKNPKIKEPTIYCRSCGKKMYNPSKICCVALFCKKCKVKAEVVYSETPEVTLFAKENKPKSNCEACQHLGYACVKHEKKHYCKTCKCRIWQRGDGKWFHCFMLKHDNGGCKHGCTEARWK